MIRSEKNLINDIVNPQNKNETSDFELTGSDSLVKNLDIVSVALDRDKPLTLADLDVLDADLRSIAVNIGGEMMTVEEAKKIPDLKMNMEIWAEIRKGDCERSYELTFITNEILQILVHHAEDLCLGSITSAKGLVFPENTRGDLILSGITSAEGLMLPKTVLGNLDLGHLTSAKGLVLPEYILGGINLGDITSPEGLVLPKHIGQYLDLSGITSLDGLVLPGGIKNLYVEGLTSLSDEWAKRLVPYFDNIVTSQYIFDKIRQFKQP
jgi:hypothetical protein